MPLPSAAPPVLCYPPATPTNELHIVIEPIGRLFTDDTGKFPARSRSGNQYVMVAYHVDTNVILVAPFQSRADRHRLPAYNSIMTRLADKGHLVNLQILDNEASAEYKRTIETKWKARFQLVPPHVHRRNRAERAIRTFKDHFIAILAGIDKTFPKSLWDLLLPQAEITVNLLRQSTTLPTMSAWEHFNGLLNFDATPLGPLGCRVLYHAKAAVRRSWDVRGNDGFYIGPAMDHYRCFTIVNAASHASMISDTVAFRHDFLQHLTPTPSDRLLHGLRVLTEALQDAPHTSCDDQLNAIADLRDLFSNWRNQARPTTTPTQGPSTPNPNPHWGPPRVMRAVPSIRPADTPTAEPSSPSPAPPAAPVALPPRVDHAADSGWTTVPTRPLTRSITRPPEPIAQRTRASCPNYYAALARTPGITPACQQPLRPLQATLRTCIISPKLYSQAALDALCDQALPNLAAPVLDHETGLTLEHRQLRRHPKYKDIWATSYANELGRLCQGVGTSPTDSSKKRVEGTDTFHVVNFDDIPSDRRKEITYTKVVCEYRPQKSEPNRTRITIGGNRICYPGDCGTRTASLELFKLQVNSVLSRPGAAFACFDLKNFYLGTPLHRPEYARIKLADIPAEFADEYNLAAVVDHNDWVYFEIRKGVYGLPQAGKLANDLLTERLARHGYYQCATTPGLWRHKWRPIMFVLIVDDFGIEYVGKRHADHLLAALQEHYEVTTDWTGTKFTGIDITWDYIKRTCRLAMDGYILDVLTKYGHPAPSKPQHAPHQHREIDYGAKTQLTPEADTSPPLGPDEVKRIQGIVGSLLYYGRAVDNKLLVALSAIGSQQAQATENTKLNVHQLLDYVATYPSDGTTYRASHMILAAHSDASFLNESKSRSRAGAHIFLTEDEPIPRFNGAILTIAQIIKFVMASAAEAELAALFITAREMVPLRQTLIEMGWPQPKSPIQTDNSTAVGFTNDTIVGRRVKMMDMRINWLRCRESQDQFRYYWDKGSNNWADYSTKHHPPIYHLAHRGTHAG